MHQRPSSGFGSRRRRLGIVGALLAYALLLTLVGGLARGVGEPAGPAADVALGARVPAHERTVWAGPRGITTAPGLSEGRHRFGQLGAPAGPRPLGMAAGPDAEPLAAGAPRPPHLALRRRNAVRAPPAP